MNVQNLSIDVGCTVIYGGDSNSRESLYQQLTKSLPQFCCGVLPTLTAKPGLFQKKRTLSEALLKDVPKAQQSDVARGLERQGKALKIGGQLFRQPATLSYRQMLIWSMLREALLGKACFLVKDTGDEASLQQTGELVCLLMQLNRNMQILWITGRDEADLMRLVFPDDPSDRYEDMFLTAAAEVLTLFDAGTVFYKLQNDELILRSKFTLEAELKPRMLAEQAAIDAAHKELLSQALALEKQKRFVEAIDLYERLISEKCPLAHIQAARLYFAHRRNLPYEDPLDRAYELCSIALKKYGLTEALLILGDYTMTFLDTYSKEDTHNRYNTVKNAAANYILAANRGSEEGAYKAASLCLRFRLSSTWSDGEVIYRLGPEDAIPYIKQLFSLRDKGSADAERKLLLLLLTDYEIYTRAEQEYKSE